jgi:glycopeptide antibiotics resistance protein
LKVSQDRQPWRLALLALSVPLVLIAFWPTPVDQPVSLQLTTALSLLHLCGMPTWFTYDSVEGLANVLLFAPLGFVAKLAFPSKRWWQIGAFGLIISGFMELGQLLYLNNRFASPFDMLMNSLGSLLGLGLSWMSTKSGRPLAFRQRASEEHQDGF